MFQSVEISRMAQAMARHAGARQAVIASNIAQADTPGYKARDLPAFAASYAAGDGLRATRAGHAPAQAAFATRPIAGGSGAAPNGNSVSLETEMVKAVEARQQHDMALAIYRSVSTILRTSLGRGGR
ncbi:FlgB family protein [Fertoebacter nigrum]|uniref:FlgB family protein n=1 Tax=Fertoeibacter niger TaxID=2656921 RepID=A0A8X8KQZ2_9RHOB|nr:FlgB family protein [Fertoeibacter niger]NUB44617.1 FlgB family protein [Fertoeibacter niger]